MIQGFERQLDRTRPRGGELSEAQRSAILSAVSGGESKTAIAHRFGVSRRVIYNTIERWNERQSLQSRPRPGQPEKLTRFQKLKLLRLARANPTIKYCQLKAEVHGIHCHEKTIYRLLKKHHIIRWRAKKRPKLTKEVAKIRRWWARVYRNFDFSQVSFSDECSAERGKGKAVMWVFRTPHQKWDHEMLDTEGPGKNLRQMFYGVVQYNNRSELIAMKRDPVGKKNGYTAVSYIWAMEDGLLDIFDPENDIYLMDNARIHTAHITLDLLESWGIECLPIPPYSPDLNIIEHVWALLKRKLNEMYPNLADAPKTEEEKERFIHCAQEAWRAIPQRTVQKLFNSMQRRLRAVRKAHGWQTKY